MNSKEFIEWLLNEEKDHDHLREYHSKVNNSTGMIREEAKAEQTFIIKEMYMKVIE